MSIRHTLWLVFFSTAPLWAGGTLDFTSVNFQQGSLSQMEVENNELKPYSHWSFSNSAIGGRESFGYSYDNSKQESLIYGGRDELGTAFSDTKIKTSTGNWVTVFPSSNPGARYGHGLVWMGDKHILFGGLNQTGDHLNDTWIFNPDTDNWSYLVTPSSPAPRAFHSMVYSTTSHKVVMFGGQYSSFVTTNETWIFDPDTLTWSLANPNPQPSFRRGAAMAFDYQNQKVILFGGRHSTWDFSDIYADTWAYDIPSNTWSNLTPANPPLFRTDSSMAYEPQFRRMILFSGRYTPALFREDVYFFDYQNNKWKIYQDPSKPSGRYGHKTIYDIALQKITTLGGRRDVATEAQYFLTHQTTGSWVSQSSLVPLETSLIWNSINLTFVDPFHTPPPAPETSIEAQIASSADGMNFTQFHGPDGSTTTYHVFKSSSAQTIWNGHNNQPYIKLKLNFSSNDPPNRPIISQIRLTYNQAPYKPTLTSPANNTITNSMRPTFSWDAVGDPDGVQDNPLLYQIEIDDDPQFLTPFLSIENMAPTGVVVSTTIGTDLPEGLWFWRTRAKDNQNFYGPWASSFTITVDTTTPPAPVTEIEAVMSSNAGEINLTWTFPGDDDGKLENGLTLIRYSTLTALLSELDWTNAMGEKIHPLNADPGESIGSTVTGLSDDTTYHFAIKTVDELGNTSLISHVSPSAKTPGPPSPVTFITASNGPGPNQVSLNWIFPGDEGANLNLGHYFVRISTEGAINSEILWNLAPTELMFNFSAAPGESIQTIVTGLSEVTTYFFSIKTRDNHGHTSLISTISPNLLTNGSPHAVTQLSAARGPSNQQITLNWIFPGDYEGNLTNGFAIVRYSKTNPITNESQWQSASGEQIIPLTANINDPQSTVISNLESSTLYYFSIKIQDQFQLQSGISLTSPSAQTNSAPTVTLNSPHIGVLSDEVQINWISSDPDNGDTLLTNLRLSLDGGQTFPILFAQNLPAGTSSYFWKTIALPNRNNYRVQVEVVDNFGLSATDRSDFNLIKNNASIAPIVSFTTAPTSMETISGTYHVGWEVENSTIYANYSFTLSISDNDGTSYSVLTTTTGTLFSLNTLNFSNQKKYKLKIEASDAGVPPLIGRDTSETFEINNDFPPASFSLLWPLENDFPSAFDLNLSWNASSDPNGGPIHYRLTLSTNSDMTAAFVVSNLIQTVYLIPINSIIFETSYFWTVTAIDAGGQETLSNTGTFTVSRTKAKSRDRLLTIDILSGLPEKGLISIDDGKSTHSDLVESSNQDAIADRLIKVLGLPIWDVTIKDTLENILDSHNVQARLQFDVETTKNSAEAQSVDQNHMKLAKLNKATRRWELIPTQSNKISSPQAHQATVTGFSLFNVVASVSPSQNLTGIFNYPNPFNPGNEQTRIRYILTDHSDVTIRIYSLMGDLVKELNYQAGLPGGQGATTGFTNEVFWDGRNGKSHTVANGVYIAEIQAKASGNIRKGIRKIGVLK